MAPIEFRTADRRVQRTSPDDQPPQLAASQFDKNVTVVESWFYTAAETTDYGSVSTDRDSASLAINAAQESPWGRSKRGPGAFPFRAV
jgi:hypothetical protein